MTKPLYARYIKRKKNHFYVHLDLSGPQLVLLHEMKLNNGSLYVDPKSHQNRTAEVLRKKGLMKWADSAPSVFDLTEVGWQIVRFTDEPVRVRLKPLTKKQ